MDYKSKNISGFEAGVGGNQKSVQIGWDTRI